MLQVDGVTVQALVRAAESGLEATKKAGKNQVVHWVYNKGDVPH